MDWKGALAPLEQSSSGADAPFQSTSPRIRPLPTRLTFLALLSCIVHFSLTATAQPQLKIEALPHVSKVTPTDHEAKEIVTISNVGTEDLQLKVENTSCGCTDAILSTESLPPGHKGTLTIKMRLSGWGVKMESVTLHTNDLQQPYPVVNFRVALPASVVSIPSRLMIQAREGNMEQQFLSLLLPDGVTVTKLSLHHFYIQAKTIESQPVKGGTLQRIEVLLLPTAIAGDLKDDLTIDLKGASMPQIIVAIEGSVTGSGLIRGDVDWKGASAPLLLCSSGANAPFQSITDAGALVTSR